MDSSGFSRELTKSTAASTLGTDRMGSTGPKISSRMMRASAAAHSRW